MTLPADIAKIRHAWSRRAGDAWTSETFRSPVKVWLDGFLVGHSWARSISVVEKFHGADLNRRKPYGPYHRARDPRTIEEGFRQSSAPPVLVFTAVRDADSEEFECALTFPDGALTDIPSVEFYLGRAAASLEAEEARRPL